MNPAQMISIAHGDLKSLESELNEANAKLAEANKKLAARKAEPQPQPPPSTQVHTFSAEQVWQVIRGIGLDVKKSAVPENASWTEDQVIKFLLANGANELPGAWTERLANALYGKR